MTYLCTMVYIIIKFFSFSMKNTGVYANFNPYFHLFYFCLIFSLLLHFFIHILNILCIFLLFLPCREAAAKDYFLLLGPSRSNPPPPELSGYLKLFILSKTFQKCWFYFLVRPLYNLTKMTCIQVWFFEIENNRFYIHPIIPIIRGLKLQKPTFRVVCRYTAEFVARILIYVINNGANQVWLRSFSLYYLQRRYKYVGENILIILNLSTENIPSHPTIWYRFENTLLLYTNKAYFCCHPSMVPSAGSCE